MYLLRDHHGVEDVTRQQLIAELTDCPLVEGNIAVLSRDDEIYIQMMVLGGGFVIEKRDGNADSHFEALPRDSRAKIEIPNPWWKFWGAAAQESVFTRQELVRIFTRYFDGQDTPELVRWNSI